MANPENENDETPKVAVLSELIDHWWENEDQRTVHHDGVELIASITLAKFLLDSGVVIPPGKTTSDE